MPSADQVPVKTPHSTMRWHLWVVLIAGSTGSALRAVRPPNLRITPGIRRDLVTPPVRRVLCSVRPWTSWPTPFVRSCWRVRSRRPSLAAWPTHCEPRPVLGAMDLGIADDRQCAGREQAARIAIALFADTAELVLAPARVLLRHEPDPTEKSRPDRKAFGSATLATRAVASAGPTPGISSSRLLAWLDRCQAVILRSDSRICALSTRSWAPRAGGRGRAISGP